MAFGWRLAYLGVSRNQASTLLNIIASGIAGLYPRRLFRLVLLEIEQHRFRLWCCRLGFHCNARLLVHMPLETLTLAAIQTPSCFVTCTNGTLLPFSATSTGHCEVKLFRAHIPPFCSSSLQDLGTTAPRLLHSGLSSQIRNWTPFLPSAWNNDEAWSLRCLPT